MEEASPSKRQFARDVSNIIADTLSPRNVLGNTQVALQCVQVNNVETGPNPTGCWTSADTFKFVEDDDEVLFRVRDSGVLRSLALPGLSSATSALNTEETLEDKQVAD